MIFREILQRNDETATDYTVEVMRIALAMSVF
jgi:hypothetical protein